jgi:hypothetical protein
MHREYLENVNVTTRHLIGELHYSLECDWLLDFGSDHSDWLNMTLTRFDWLPLYRVVAEAFDWLVRYCDECYLYLFDHLKGS